MSHLQKLKAAQSRKDLAEILGYQPSALTAIVYMTSAAVKYTTFDIPKKSGGVRTIKAPEPKLKKLQKHLARVLYGCLAEIEAGRDTKPVSFGFREKGRITDHAKNHKRRRYVLNVDLADFFPTFNFGRVRGFFLKDQNFQLATEVATTIAQIACDGVALPQGSPCSPVISELIGQVLDLRLLRLSKKFGVRYSRYADDLTFSTNNKQFPAALAVHDTADQNTWVIGDELVNKIKRAGFNINTTKTRLHCRGSRQMVTGLVVNDKVNIKSEYYRNARAMCDALFQTGRYFKEYLPPAKIGDSPRPNYISSLNTLEGILCHIYNVTQTEERRNVVDQRQKPRAIRHLYHRFLFYKYCIALESPLIITEGKTDPLYLRLAIKHRPAYHPRLGSAGHDGFELGIKLFNYGKQAHEILDLGGGAGDLKSIVLDYCHNFYGLKPYKNRKPIKHKPVKHPVIIVLDNDDGLNGVAGVLKKNFGISISAESTKPFYHITDNLYLVKTPETSGKKSCIEDLFPAKWLKVSLNGKIFNASKELNNSKEYGKTYLAKSVIKPNAVSIDFSGFDPLLDRIIAVLDHYKP